MQVSRDSQFSRFGDQGDICMLPKRDIASCQKLVNEVEKGF